MKIIFVNGCPGSKKAEYIEKLKDDENLPVINMGMLLPEAMKKNDDNIEWFLCVEDLVMDVVYEFSQCGAGVIVDSFWNEQEQKEVESFCELRSVKFDWINLSTAKESDDYYKLLLGKNYHGETALCSNDVFENYLDGWPIPDKYK